MTTVDVLLERATELKRQLVEYAQRPRYDRAFRDMLARQGATADPEDDDQGPVLLDSFMFEHRLRNGRTVVEQFVDARPDLSPEDRELLLGWRDVVVGVFEVQRRDGAALVLLNLVDDLTYRARSNMGASALDRMPRRSFVLARLVPIGDEWMFSGPVSLLPGKDGSLAARLALQLTQDMPEAVFRNPDRLARAHELQRTERQRFIRFFGSDFVVVPGDRAQQRLDEFADFSLAELIRENPAAARRAGTAHAPRLELPPELVEAGPVAFLFDEEDGLGFCADVGLLEEAFAEPDLVRQRRYRTRVRSALDDDSVPPMLLRRLADRDPAKASALFGRLIKRPGFDWARDGETLLREAKADYYASPHLPQISPVSDRLAALARRR